MILAAQKLADYFDTLNSELRLKVNQLSDLAKKIEHEKSKVQTSALNFDDFDETEKAEIEKELAQPIPTKWVQLFGDLSLRALFEGETQRFFAKGMIDQNGIERACIFHGKNKYLPCSPVLYLMLNLPNYKVYQANDGTYTADVSDYLPEHEELLKQADRQLTKAIIADWQKQIAESNVPNLLKQLSILVTT